MRMHITLRALHEGLFALAHRVWDSLYIDEKEPEWDVLRYTGDVMFYLGIILLIYDYFIIDACHVYTGALPKNIVLFIINPQCSHVCLFNQSQFWLFLIMAGGFFTTLGGVMSNAPKKVPWLRKALNKRKNI